jgi:hypothetical protein
VVQELLTWATSDILGSSTTHAHLHFEQRYRKGADFTDERDRVPAYFNGKRYSGQNAEWKSVTSRNC